MLIEEIFLWGPDIEKNEPPAEKEPFDVQKSLSGPIKKTAEVDKIESDGFVQSILGEPLTPQTEYKKVEAATANEDKLFAKLAQEVIDDVLKQVAPQLQDKKCECSCMNCQQGNCKDCASETKCAAYMAMRAEPKKSVKAEKLKKIKKDVNNIVTDFRRDVDLDDDEFWDEFSDHLRYYVLESLGTA